MMFPVFAEPNLEILVAHKKILLTPQKSGGDFARLRDRYGGAVWLPFRLACGLAAISYRVSGLSESRRLGV